MVVSDDDEEQQHAWEEENASQEDPIQIPWIIRFPLRLITASVGFSLRLIRPYTTQLIPLVILTLTIPLLVTLSLSSGWMVWRRIAVGWDTELYLQYGDGVAPYAYADLPLLSWQQPYDISLHLRVPASQTNLELGNFMSALTLTTLNNKTVASTRRTGVVLPPSLLWSHARTVDITIPLLSRVEFRQQRMVAYVEIGRNDQWRNLGSGQGRELSVVSASLRGVVVHSGLRGLFTRFPLLTALAAAVTFFTISFGIIASCLLPMIGQPQDEDRVYTPLPTVNDAPHRKKSKRSIDTEKAVAVKRSPSVDISPKSEVKSEEMVPILPSEPSTTPLRRRRSRLSQHSDSDT